MKTEHKEQKEHDYTVSKKETFLYLIIIIINMFMSYYKNIVLVVIWTHDLWLLYSHYIIIFRFWLSYKRKDPTYKTLRHLAHPMDSKQSWEWPEATKVSNALFN